MNKFTRSRKEKLFKPEPKSHYGLNAKPRGTQVCRECQAVFHQGRWDWSVPEASAERVLCPACQRIANQEPAGFLTLDGGFFQTHHQEIVELMRSTEQAESREHPLERLMGFQENADGAQVTTTGTHLVQRLAHALNASFKGKAEYQFDAGKSRVDVYWSPRG